MCWFYYRYTLCEMSLTWSMYGGTDFRPASEPASSKKTVTIDDSRKQGSPTALKLVLELGLGLVS